jgi:hypothetical protein
MRRTSLSLQICCWWAEKLPDNVTCGEGCREFPACLPTLELIHKLADRRAALDHAEEDTECQPWT